MHRPCRLTIHAVRGYVPVDLSRITLLAPSHHRHRSAKERGVRESHFRNSRRTRSRRCVDVKAVVNKGIWRREPVSDPRPAEPSWTLSDGFCPVNTETPSSAVHRPRPEMIRMPRQLLLPRTRNSLLRVASEFPPHNECASVRPRDSECDQGGNNYIRAAGQGRTQARALQKPLARTTAQLFANSTRKKSCPSCTNLSRSEGSAG